MEARWRTLIGFPAQQPGRQEWERVLSTQQDGTINLSLKEGGLPARPGAKSWRRRWLARGTPRTAARRCRPDGRHTKIRDSPRTGAVRIKRLFEARRAIRETRRPAIKQAPTPSTATSLISTPPSATTKAATMHASMTKSTAPQALGIEVTQVFTWHFSGEGECRQWQ